MAKEKNAQLLVFQFELCSRRIHSAIVATVSWKIERGVEQYNVGADGA